MKRRPLRYVTMACIGVVVLNAMLHWRIEERTALGENGFEGATRNTSAPHQPQLYAESLPPLDLPSPKISARDAVHPYAFPITTAEPPVPNPGYIPATGAVIDRALAYALVPDVRPTRSEPELPALPKLPRVTVMVPQTVPTPVIERDLKLFELKPTRKPQKTETALARNIITKMMPEAQAVEHQIWLEEVQELPAEEIARLLAIRNQLGSIAECKPPQFRSKKREVKQTKKPARLPTYRTSQREADLHLERTLKALRRAESVILHNLANSETYGFKRSRPLFTDLPSVHHQHPGRTNAHGQLTTVGISVGEGSQLGGTQLIYTQGEVKTTNYAYDIAINGDGFLAVTDGKSIYYTRSGHLTPNANGELTLASTHQGFTLEPSIVIPEDATALSISADGVVTVRQEGSYDLVRIGQISLCRFQNPAGLEQQGDHVLAATNGSGPAHVGIPGTHGLGDLQQGFLELSTIQPEQEVKELKHIRERIQRILSLGVTSDSKPDRTAEQKLRELSTRDGFDSDRFWKQYILSPKAKSIEQNLGLE